MLLSSISVGGSFRFADSGNPPKSKSHKLQLNSKPIAVTVLREDSGPNDCVSPATTDELILDKSIRVTSLPLSATESRSEQNLNQGECLSAMPYEEKLVIVMVGLPARGKSYLAKKVKRYLNWSQYPTRIFNVGERRREMAVLHPAPLETSDSQQQTNQHSANFFHPNNEAASKLREDLAMEVLDNLLLWLEKGGCIGIFDATNTSVARRDMVVQRIRKANPSPQVLFLETQCVNQNVLDFNMMLKLYGPDYKNCDPIEALVDFKRRVAMYEMKYTPIGQHEEDMGYSYCQVIDVGRKFIAHNINDFLSAQTVAYLQNFHLYPRQIWLTRHGESEDDIAGRLGGDSPLSKRGLDFAQALPTFISQYQSKERKSPSQWMSKVASLAETFNIWTSISQKSIQTAQFFNECHKKHLKALDELSAGSLEGLTREDVRFQFADWFERRETNKFSCRYPGTAGEGYCDVTYRLRNIILEIERTKNHTMVISGLAVIRVLIAYFLGMMPAEIPTLEVPQGWLYMFEPQPYGIRKVEFAFDDEMKWFKEVDTRI